MVVVGAAGSHPGTFAVAFILCAQISFDRMLGYGLKFSDSFKTTHLGTLGRRPS
jgi:hypothetical protein